MFRKVIRSIKPLRPEDQWRILFVILMGMVNAMIPALREVGHLPLWPLFGVQIATVIVDIWILLPMIRRNQRGE